MKWVHLVHLGLEEKQVLLVLWEALAHLVKEEAQVNQGLLVHWVNQVPQASVENQVCQDLVVDLDSLDLLETQDH